jgi:hypothetical protein
MLWKVLTHVVVHRAESLLELLQFFQTALLLEELELFFAWQDR